MTDSNQPCDHAERKPHVIAVQGDNAIALLRAIWMGGYASGCGSSYMTITSAAPIAQALREAATDQFVARMVDGLNGDRLSIEAVNREIQEILTGVDSGPTTYSLDSYFADPLEELAEGGDGR